MGDRVHGLSRQQANGTNVMTQYDIAVIGGGAVGLAAALVSARFGFKTIVVEAHAPISWQQDSPDLRVYALALDNQMLLEDLAVWKHIIERRAFAYNSMTVFDEVQSNPLRFHANELGRSHLGHIVENRLLVDSLWQAAMAEPAIQLVCPDKIKAIETIGESVSVSLQSGLQFSARLAIGADGAGSKVRDLLGIESDVHDYHQKGLVAFVETELPHQNTAWQRFLSTGPLAFLPFGEKECSIVWSLPKGKADQLLADGPEAFCRSLDSAIAGTLGKTRLISDRVAFPLKRQLAKSMLQGRTLLLGDAAHAVHPLAGQGVNLGLRDVSALAKAFETASVKTGDALDLEQIRRWAGKRYSENAVAALAFENINRMFSNDNFALSLIRGHVFGLADKLGPLKNAMARFAAGI